ncbi:MAG: hypothetical protein H7A39_06385 [Chlamydiales bacterium]|nr:hypothetical protein [Chlamydiales bacterium]
MKYTQIAKNLFEWNVANLVFTAHLKKSDIADYFADSFLVIANGKQYEANYNNYFEFLNQFRSTIRKISYKFGDFIEDRMHVVIPLKAQIIRTNDTEENFEAILILKFNGHNKIILWHEVYLRV